MLADVCFGSFASIAAYPSEVRFTPDSNSGLQKSDAKCQNTAFGVPTRAKASAFRIAVSLDPPK